MHDVIVVGGSYAGMAAALQLVRARRTVLVIDAGKRRNRFAHRSHGFLGQDGADPAVMAAEARRQLQAYPSLTWVDGLVASASGSKDHFSVTMDDGQTHTGRRLLLATGVTDELPAVDGLAERWGKTSSIALIVTATSWTKGTSGSSPPDRCRSTRRNCFRNGGA